MLGKTIHPYNLCQLSSVILVIVALFFSTFCLTASITSTHAGHTEQTTDTIHYDEPLNDECCHGIFHEKKHGSIKTTNISQQATEQTVAVYSSIIPDLIIVINDSRNNLGYLKNFVEYSSSPGSILRC